MSATLTNANPPAILRGITWNDPRGYGPMEAVGKAFAQTNAGRGISVQWDIHSLSDFESRPLLELAQHYDLINMDHPHVGDAVALGCLKPIEDLSDDYLGPSLDSYKMRDRCWCVPIDASCMVAAFHPARIADIPRRYDEVFAMARSGVRVGASLAGVHAFMALLTLLSQLGHPITSDAENGLPSLEVLNRAAELLRELQQVLIGPSLSWNPIQLLRAIGDGECDYAVFTFAYITFQKGGVRFVPVPTWEDSPSRGAVIGGTGLAVSAYSNHSEAALAFARFVGSESVQTGLWPQHGGQPAHRRAWELLSSTDDFFCSLMPAVETSYVRPRFAGWSRFQSQAGELICSWLGQRTAHSNELCRQFQQLWAQANPPS